MKKIKNSKHFLRLKANVNVQLVMAGEDGFATVEIAAVCLLFVFMVNQQSKKRR